MAERTYPDAQTEWIDYGDRVRGFLAVPTRGQAPFGAVILCHERYGLVQHTLDLAAKFAADGYLALAPDLFSRWEGDREALTRGDIQVHLADAELRAILGESLDYLRAERRVDAARIACMGVCQSGDYPLLLNSVRPEIMANVVVYGGAQQTVWEQSERRPEPYADIVASITAPVLGIFGEKDQVVSVDDVCRLRNTLEAHRKSYEFSLFADMPHGWFNDTMPGRYRPRETAIAWAMILDFLARVARGELPPDRVRWRFESDIATTYDFTKNVRLA